MTKPETIEELRLENKRQDAELSKLREDFQKLAQAQNLECVIENGVEKIATMLEPLRSLRPARAPLEPDYAAALHALHATLARPSYENLESQGLDSFIAINTGKSGGKKS